MWTGLVDKFLHVICVFIFVSDLVLHLLAVLLAVLAYMRFDGASIICCLTSCYMRDWQGKAGCIHMSYHIIYHHISYHISSHIISYIITYHDASWTFLAYAARVQLTQTANSEARKNHMILHAWLACWMQCNVCLQRIRLIQLTGRRLENSGCIQKTMCLLAPVLCTHHQAAILGCSRYDR